MECCRDFIIQEMSAESVSLNHDNPSDFVKAQWPVNHKVYVLYRLAVSLGFITWFVFDVIYEAEEFYKDNKYNYLIYATNWSFLLLALSTVLMAVCCLYYSIRSGECLDRQTFERMPNALKMQWLLQNLSYNSAIVVTASYWAFVSILDKSLVLHTRMSQLKHTLNSVYVLVDIFISGTPFRILHLFFTVGLGSVYSLFNAIYFLNDGTILEGRHYAYNLLDWSKPSEAIVTCTLCVVLCVFSQIILYEMYKIRLGLFTKIYFGTEVEKPDSEMQSIISDAPAYMTINDREQELHTETEECQ